VFYFPQLSSGATGQFPITRQRVARTAVNQSVQDYQVKLADPGAAITAWHLSFEEISDQELAALEALFQAVEGSLTPFTFLDPVDNLLAWSEQQNQAVWQPDPLLVVTGGVADPMGGTNAYQLSNPTGATLSLQQAIPGPASLNYCLSLYACSGQGTQVWLVRGSALEACEVSPQWARLISAGQLQDTADSISFGVALDPGATVKVFGIQVEAQTTASMYKQTTETGGVYPNARFKSDTMTITTVGPGRNSCELDIVNVEYL
jgi:hypothetical protein